MSSIEGAIYNGLKTVLDNMYAIDAISDDREITDEEKEAFINELVSTCAETRELVSAKAESFLDVTDAYIKSYEDKISRLTKRKKILENVQERVKQRIVELVELSGEIEGESVTFTFRPSESVEITDFEALPPEYKRIKYEPNKADLGRDLKAGVTIPGAELKRNHNFRRR